MSALADLPGKARASWTTDGIYIDRSLGQAARRCALTHEIVHLERGPVPADSRLAVIEERIVSVIAAKRLITLHQLIEALMWAAPTSLYELAEELWVDLSTLRIRLRHLTAKEVQRVNDEIAGRRPWHQ
ncbi:hypothetical protein [Nocardia sp. NPDC046763]|uniref:hypothetical protein n=1 Tax=Nocardia sp. NPDC046763 TaxID=3155256 RepID=UPI0033F1EC06